MMRRRGFLGSILAAGFAPAFIGSQVLMPVKAITKPQPMIRGIVGDAPQLTVTGGGLSVGDIFSITGIPGRYRVTEERGGVAVFSAFSG